MFRTSCRYLLRKLLDDGVPCMRCASTRFLSNWIEDVFNGNLSQESLSWFHGSYANSFPPLHSSPPDLKLPPSLPDYVKPSSTRVTMLPNGLKIASEDSPGPAACIGLFVDCGSIYESQNSIGITDLLAKLAFKGKKNRSHLRIVHEVEATGGNVGASASREQMGYTYDMLKTYIPEAVELLIDCIRNPVFVDGKVKEQLAKVKAEIRETLNNSQQFLLEALHPTGFSGALGNPLMAPESALEQIDGSVIKKFYFENYTAKGMVLAAYGVDHEELLALAKPLLNDLQSGSSMEVPKSIYVGGDFRYYADLQANRNTHVIVAFEVPGGWHNEKDATAATVLQASDFVKKAVEVAVDELLSVATPGQVTELELQRAKNATKSAVFINLESRLIVTEDIGRQILTYGCRKPVEHFLTAIDELSLDDLTEIAQKILSSPLTMSSLGDVDCIPSYDYVSRQFKAMS